jgi:GT2 family glycosyltransferase
MRVGVILAARAPVPFIADALESALAQDPAPARIVAVDHGSEPPLGSFDGAQVVRTDDASGGPAAARDAGLAALDTDLIALLDADDVWEPGKLAPQLAVFEAHPEVAVCFGRATVIGANGQPTGERLAEAADGVAAAALYADNPIPASSAVVRREALEAVGGFAAGAELPAASDWDLWLRLAAAGYEFRYDPRARIQYRRHAGGLTSDVARLAEARLAIHDRHRELVDAATARRTRARDLELLARGRIRERRYTEAREALKEAAELEGPAARERLLRALVAVPGLRSALGRRSPYR